MRESLKVGSRATLEGLLCARNRHLLDVLPDAPGDALDAYIFKVVERMAVAVRGCGFEAIQAGVKLEKMRAMSYAELRSAAEQSPDYLNG